MKLRILLLGAPFVLFGVGLVRICQPLLFSGVHYRNPMCGYDQFLNRTLFHINNNPEIILISTFFYFFLVLLFIKNRSTNGDITTTIPMGKALILASVLNGIFIFLIIILFEKFHINPAKYAGVPMFDGMIASAFSLIMLVVGLVFSTIAGTKSVMRKLQTNSTSAASKENRDEI